MKIQVEILQKRIDPIDSMTEIWKVDNLKTFIISNIKNSTTIQEAKDKLTELKLTLAADQKIRVLEYHNDDSDNNRKPCIILHE